MVKAQRSVKKYCLSRFTHICIHILLSEGKPFSTTRFASNTGTNKSTQKQNVIKRTINHNKSSLSVFVFIAKLFKSQYNLIIFPAVTRVNDS